MGFDRSKLRRNPAGVATGLLLLSGAMTYSSAGLAAGALAVAVPDDVARSGFSYGFARNVSPSQAEADALNRCRTTKDAVNDADLRGLCAVIERFADRCVAVAMDPKNGTPGVGWGIAPGLAAAREMAMTKCRNTAGEDRREFCVVDNSGCDGAAK